MLTIRSLLNKLFAYIEQLKCRPTVLFSTPEPAILLPQNMEVSKTRAVPSENCNFYTLSQIQS